MEGASQFLVIILACALAVLLVLAIAIAILSIKALRRINHITEKAEKVVDAAEYIGTLIRRMATPAAVGKAVSKFAKSFRSKSNNKEG